MILEAGMMSSPRSTKPDIRLEGSQRKNYTQAKADQIYELKVEVNTPESSSQSRNTKRKPSDDLEVPSPQSKKLKSYYNDHYLHLLNEEICDADSRFLVDEAQPLRSSQNGVTYWSSAEKELFFAALTKLGSDDLPGIEAVVESKSLAEVHDYILLLQENLVENQLDASHASTLHRSEVPAAAEISQACCDAQERFADTLGQLLEHREWKRERKRHGDVSVLDLHLARQIEALHLSNTQSDTRGRGRNGDARIESPSSSRASSDSEPSSSEDLDKAAPAVRLLQLSRWLKLSETIFMNAGHARQLENWRSVGENDERPSLFFTALQDFHNLAVSITQRLVQVSIFQALSRLRAKDTRSVKVSKPLVRCSDVYTALEVLGMPRNSHGFWAKAAQKSGVIVTEEIAASEGSLETTRTLSYDEVYERLTENQVFQCKPGADDVQYEDVTAHRASGNEHLPISRQTINTDDDMEQMDEEDVESEFEDSTISDSEPIDFADAQARLIRGTTEDQDWKCRHDLELEQDEEAERFDQAASMAEEQKLWDILGLQQPNDLRETSPNLPLQSKLARQMRAEMIDWRDWTENLAEWERFTGFVPESEFAATDRQRQRKSVSAHECAAGTYGIVRSKEDSRVGSQTDHR